MKEIMNEWEGNERKAWLLAVMGSAVANALTIWLLSSFEHKPKPAPAPLPFKSITLDLTMEQITKEVIVPATQIQPTEKQRYQQTNANQAQDTAPVNPKFVGDRNTHAASDSQPVIDERAQPNISGVEKRTREEVQTETLDFSETDQPEPDANVTAEAQKSIPKKAGDLLESGSAAEKQAAADDEKKALAKAETEKKKAEEERKKADESKDKTKMVGSISRMGEASVDVADTPLGRHKGSISKAVNVEWLAYCQKYKNLIAPGAFTLNFIVDPDGRVDKITITNVKGNSEELNTQKAFTMNAVRNAKIPPMPKSARKELKGKALDVTYVFYF